MTRALLTLPLFVCPVCLSGQTAPVTLPSGTQLPVSIPAHIPLKLGQPIRAELLYPVYEHDRLVLPAKTVVTGSIVGLNPDHKKRVTSALRADFTPYRKAVVRFTSIVPPGGPPVPIATGEAADGAPIYKLLPTAKPKGGFIGQYFEFGMGYLRDSLQFITAPGKGDRFVQFLYTQLPWHPQRIAEGTSWTVETTDPVFVTPIPEPPAPPASVPAKPLRGIRKLLAPPAPIPPVPVAPSDIPTWTLKAYLDDAISSESSTRDQVIHATVAEPVLNDDGSIAVPQGSVLTGTVTQARPARHFTRSGILRFTFSQLQLPGQEAQSVRASLTSADSSSAAQLAMDSEGQVRPQAQDKILIPALLLLIASRPLDQGEHGGSDHIAGKDGAASSGIGLITLAVSLAANQPNFALGVGFYSAAVSLYPRFIGKGTAVEFPKDTRIVLQTAATRSTSIKAASKHE